jgi:hypothetical protein
MKYGINLLIVLITFCCLPISGQEISIGQRILNYPDSKEDYIEKGRRLLIHQFENMDFDSVKLVMNYLEDHIDDHTYLSFLPGERILLYYWTKQYDRLTMFILNIDKEKEHEYVPANHRVGEIAVKWSVQDYDILNQWINESESGAEDKDFLILLLKMMLADHLLPNIPQQELNDASDAFIARYPGSKYNEFIKTHIFFKIVPGDWGVGFGVRGGYTFHNNDYLNPKGNIDMNICVRYQRWVLDMAIMGGFGKLSRDIPDTDWFKGDKASTTHFYFSLGYAFLDNANFRISPFVGGSFNSSTPDEDLRDEYPQLEDVKINGWSPIAGANLEWKFRKKHPSYPFYQNHINLRISYLPDAFRKAGRIYSGDMWFLTLGFSFDTFGRKRIY